MTDLTAKTEEMLATWLLQDADRVERNGQTVAAENMRRSAARILRALGVEV